MQKLGDIREVLENPPIANYKPVSSPALVKPGQSANGTPT